MRLRSRGLGRKELVMDFREYELVRQDDELVIVGSIRDPVNWDFTIRICEDDIAGMIGLVFRRPMLGLLLRGLFKRRPTDHWGAERAEHLVEGKRRRIRAREQAVEKAAASVAPVAPRRPVRSVRTSPRAVAERARSARATEPLAADGS
jgi:hypothetical protein